MNVIQRTVMCTSVILALIGNHQVQGQDCEGLQVLSAFLNPFNDSEVLLLSENTNADSIYDYPSWHMLNAEGETIGVETVNYFGLWGQLWHSISLDAPWPTGNDVEPVTWSLWRGFNESASCAVSGDFAPRTWPHAGTGAEGCGPLRLELTAPGTLATGYAWELTDDQGAITAMSSGDFGGDVGWFVLSDSLCLDQQMCYALTVSGIGGPVHAHWVHASFWNGLPGFSLTTDATGEPASAFVDLYGEDCETTGWASVSRPPSSVQAWPNPTDRWLETSGLPAGNQAYEVRSLQGALLQQGMVGERGEVDLAKSPAGTLLLTLHNEVIRVVKLP